MAFYPYAPEYAAKFILTGPNGTKAVFNDLVDVNYVGVLTDVTGLDSAEVRDGGDVLTSADGGWAGNFYYGRRPITFTGTIYGHSTVQQRVAKMSLLTQATGALISDGNVSWLPSWRSTNLIPAPNMEYGVAGWAPFGTPAATTFAQSATWAAAGTKSLHVAQTAADPVYALASPQIQNVVPGTIYYAGATINAITGTSNAIVVGWYDRNGAFISQSQVNFPASTGVHALASQVTSPAGASFASFYIGNTASLASEFYVDQVFFSRESSIYIDGDQTGNFWHGTPGNSPSGNSIDMFTSFRRQQPLRYTGDFNKTFQALLISQFAPLFSTWSVVTAAGTSITAENCGDYPSFPVITVTGASPPGPQVITNTTTGLLVKFLTGYSIPTGHTVTIDVLNHVATDVTAGTSINQYIDYVASTWPTLVKGINTFTITGGGTLSLAYRHTWS